MDKKIFGFIGLGLIGGSLARCLRNEYPDCEIMAYTRSGKSTSEALEAGVIDKIVKGPSDPALSACRMIFLCAPVGNNILALTELKKVVSKDCLITDVGSVKTNIHEAARSLGLTGQFIGGHPMTGSEKSGFSFSGDHLFENAYYILTPEKDVPAEWIEELTDFVRSLHALPLVLSCEEHDYITAAVSHLPHVIAASLVNTVHNLDSKEEHMKMIAAGGFKDITRIASSSPEMWEQICVYNHDNISKVMDEFIRLLTDARNAMNNLQGTPINEMFAASREYRDSFSDLSRGTIKKSHRVYCDIIDESGAIATIATILAVGRISIKNIGIVHNRESEEGVLCIEFYDAESSSQAAAILDHHRYKVREA